MHIDPPQNNRSPTMGRMGNATMIACNSAKSPVTGRLLFSHTRLTLLLLIAPMAASNLPPALSLFKSSKRSGGEIIHQGGSPSPITGWNQGRARREYSLETLVGQDNASMFSFKAGSDVLRSKNCHQPIMPIGARRWV